MARKRVAEMSKGVGKPKVGGPLSELIDQNGRAVDEKEFLGKYRLVCRGILKPYRRTSMLIGL